MSPSRAEGWAIAQRVLVVRLDNLGDLLMTTPAIRALKEQSPTRFVVLLASRAGAEAARFVPEIDATISYEAPWMPGGATRGAGADDRLLATLRALALDAAVIFTVYSQSALPAALFCALAGIPLRLAYARENPYGLLSDWMPDPEPHALVRHEVRRQLDLVAAVGARTPNERLSFRVPAIDRASARRKLAAAGVDTSRPWIVVHPGATAASRRYPPDRFAATIVRLGADTGCELVLTGGPDEVALAQEVNRQSGGVAKTLAGALSLPELAGAIQEAAVLVANNTGPVHLAAALGTPVVDIYALTNPQHAPWRVPSTVLYEDVPCRFCYRSVCPQTHHACLRLLAPERVAAAAHALLAERADRWDPGAPPPAGLP